MPKTLQQQFRDVRRQMRSFVQEGVLPRDQADKILEYLRRSPKAYRADKS